MFKSLIHPGVNATWNVLPYSAFIFHSKHLPAGLEAPPSAQRLENCSNYFRLRLNAVICLLPLCYSVPLWTYQLREVSELSCPSQVSAIIPAFEREAGLSFGSEAGEKLAFEDSQCENIFNFLSVKASSGMWPFKVLKRCSYKTLSVHFYGSCVLFW